MQHGFSVLLLYRLLGTFVDLTIAQATCVPLNNLQILPECTDECLNTHTRKCDREGCLCGDDLMSWCETREGPQIWFAQYGYCVLKGCPDDGDIESLMAIFTLLCEGSVGGPLNNDTVPLPLGDYAVKNTAKTTATPASSRSESQSLATLTGVIPAGTGTVASGSLSSNTAVTVSDSTVTELDDKASSMSSAVNTASSSKTTSDDQPVLSTAAIAGIAVGGAALLALIIGGAFFILHRYKRNKSTKLASPPVYEPADEKHAYGKPELDGQALEYQYSVMGVGAPTEYAELDAGAPVSPGRQSIQRSGHDERARTRQDI